MSARLLRKVLKEREEQQHRPETGEQLEHSDESDSDAPVHPSSSSVKNPFDLLSEHDQIMTTNPLSSFLLRSFLEKGKLQENGTNFMDWIRSLRNVLRQEDKLYILEQPLPEEEPLATAHRAVRDAYKKHKIDSRNVRCLMRAAMCPKLQQILEHLEAYEIGVQLRDMFRQQAWQERFDTIVAFISSKMSEGQQVGPHVLKMKGYVEYLEKLGYPIHLELATDIILNSLPKSYNNFVMNYNMQGMNKNLSELHQMLKTAEKFVEKSSPVLLVNQGQGAKAKGKGKAKVVKPKVSKRKVAKAVVTKPDKQKDAICFHCNEIGHWKRNCKIFLEEEGQAL